jgi:NADH-quinone oxidoreductase subunit C
MSAKLERLCRQLKESFGDRIGEPAINHGEVTVTVPAAAYLGVMRQLRDDPTFRFEQLMDLSGSTTSTSPATRGRDMRR